MKPLKVLKILLILSLLFSTITHSYKIKKGFWDSVKSHTNNIFGYSNNPENKQLEIDFKNNIDNISKKDKDKKFQNIAEKLTNIKIADFENTFKFLEQNKLHINICYAVINLQIKSIIKNKIFLINQCIINKLNEMSLNFESDDILIEEKLGNLIEEEAKGKDNLDLDNDIKNISIDLTKKLKKVDKIKLDECSINNTKSFIETKTFKDVSKDHPWIRYIMRAPIVSNIFYSLSKIVSIVSIAILSNYVATAVTSDAKTHIAFVGGTTSVLANLFKTDPFSLIGQSIASLAAKRTIILNILKNNSEFKEFIKNPIFLEIKGVIYKVNLEVSSSKLFIYEFSSISKIQELKKFKQELESYIDIRYEHEYKDNDIRQILKNFQTNIAKLLKPLTLESEELEINKEKLHTFNQLSNVYNNKIAVKGNYLNLNDLYDHLSIQKDKILTSNNKENTVADKIEKIKVEINKLKLEKENLQKLLHNHRYIKKYDANIKRII